MNIRRPKRPPYRDEIAKMNGEELKKELARVSMVYSRKYRDMKLIPLRYEIGKRLKLLDQIQKLLEKPQNEAQTPQA